MAQDWQVPGDAICPDEPTCMYYGKICETTETIYTGDDESYEGFECWCWCDDCQADTFHKMIKDETLSKKNYMKERKYFFTAQPVVTDDDGHLGYLWQGIVYTERDFGMSDFDPFIKTDSLFYTPDGAIDEAKKIVSNQTL